jgi:hypothetical protein
MRYFMMFIFMPFILAGAMSSAPAEDCKPGGTGCPNAQIDWKLKTYDIGEGGYYDYGTEEEHPVAAPTYSNDAPPAYPLGNTVKLQNGATCRRDGVAISCQ